MPEQAKRVKGFEDIDTSSICYWYAEHGTDGKVWLLYLPKCGLGNLKLHTVTEHEDGTITVTPSIKVWSHDAGNRTERHGHLERGVWTEIDQSL